MEEEAKIQNTARVSLHGGGICMGSELEQTPVRKEHGARKRSSCEEQRRRSTPLLESLPSPHPFPKTSAMYDGGQHPRFLPQGDKLLFAA